MRYTVRYDEFAGAWAVIDTKSPGRVISVHDNADDAKDAAWNEEERWYKCYPFSPRIAHPISSTPKESAREMPSRRKTA